VFAVDSASHVIITDRWQRSELVCNCTFSSYWR